MLGRLSQFGKIIRRCKSEYMLFEKTAEGRLVEANLTNVRWPKVIAKCKYFFSKNFFSSRKFFFEKHFCPKFFLENIFYFRKTLLAKICSRKYFVSKNIFVQHFFSKIYFFFEKHFCPKFVLENIFFSKNIFVQLFFSKIYFFFEKHFCPKFVLEKFFLSKNIFVQLFFSKIYLVGKVNGSDARISVKQIMPCVNSVRVGRITVVVTKGNNWHGFIMDDLDGATYPFYFVRDKKTEFSIFWCIFLKLFMKILIFGQNFDF